MVQRRRREWYCNYSVYVSKGQPIYTATMCFLAVFRFGLMLSGYFITFFLFFRTLFVKSVLFVVLNCFEQRRLWTTVISSYTANCNQRIQRVSVVCVCVCTRKSTSFCQCRLLTTSSTKLIIIFRENVDSLVAGALTTLHNSAHTFLHRYFHRFCLFISYYYVYRMLFTLLFMFVWDGATLQPFQRGSMYIFFLCVCV